MQFKTTMVLAVLLSLLNGCGGGGSGTRIDDESSNQLAPSLSGQYPSSSELPVQSASQTMTACSALPIDESAPEPETTIPVPREEGRHDAFLQIAKAGGIDLLFIGDSITDFWRDTGRVAWTHYWALLHSANFGIGGDKTQNVLWRLRNGELAGIQPKLVVLLIGTNNVDDSAEDVARGIKTIIHEIQVRSPVSRVLLMGIFPRGDSQDTKVKNDRTNSIISQYADQQRVVYLNINQKLLAEDGSISNEIFYDLLHPTAKGYKIWAEAILATVQKMLQDTNTCH